MIRRSILVTFTLIAIAAALPAGAQQPADAWRFTLTPYLWLPTINGTLKYQLPPGLGDGNFSARIGPNDYLSNLKAVILLSGQARKNRYSVGTDLVYLSFANEESKIRTIDFGNDTIPVDASIDSHTDTSFKGMAWTVTGGYELRNSSDSPLDAIAGFRYFGVKSSAQWQLTRTVTGPGGSHVFPSTGNASHDTNLIDGVVGLRGNARIGERWHMPYYVDVGAGSSELTWQALAGVTYAFGWGDVGVVYRHLSYDQSDDELLHNFSFSGPAATFTFHF